MQLMRRHNSFRCACVLAKVEFMYGSAVEAHCCVFAGAAAAAAACMRVTEMPER